MAFNIITTTWADLTGTVYGKKYGKVPESGTNRAGQATVYYYLPWSERWDFIRQVMGAPQIIDISGGTALIYRTPLQYVDNPALYASAFEINPVGDLVPTGGCVGPDVAETAYTTAEVGITYTTPTYPMTGDQALMEINYKAGAEEITAPDQAYSFVSDGMAVDANVGIKVANQEITVTVHRVPYVDPTVFVPYIGTVNSAAFSGYDAGYVLCNPVTTSTSYTVGNTPLSDVTYSFTWREYPWNWFLRPDGLSFALVTPTVFQSTDFNDLFN